MILLYSLYEVTRRKGVLPGENLYVYTHKNIGGYSSLFSAVKSGCRTSRCVYCLIIAQLPLLLPAVTLLVSCAGLTFLRTAFSTSVVGLETKGNLLSVDESF